MIRTPIAACLLLLAALASTLDAEVKITYLANEGVMIESGNTKLLIDALLRDSLDDYQQHSKPTQEKLETGQPPFDGIGTALATHFHLDHWDSGAITSFLKHNPTATFASSPEATAMIPLTQQKRVHAFPMGPGPQRLESGSAVIEAIPLRHGKTQHLAYRITLGGTVVAHVGDADPSPESFTALAAAGPLNVLMAPFWWLMDPKAVASIREHWPSANLVAIHFDKNSAHGPRVAKNFPNAWLCQKPGESKTY